MANQSAPKISFGFSKMKKKPNIIPQSIPVETKPQVEFITTFEHRDIDAVEQNKELVIPCSKGTFRDRIIAYQKRKEAPNGTESEIKSKKAANVIPLDDSEYPDEPTLSDYEKVPVSEFGHAVLRGMIPGKEIGKKRKVAEFREPKPRPKGLGLGAGFEAVIKLEAKEMVENKK